MLELRVHEIKDAGVIDMTAYIPAESIPFDTPDNTVLLSPVETNIHAEAFKDEVLVVANVSAKVGMTCSRCLERFDRAVPAFVEVHAPLTQPAIDLQEEVRQSLSLALPFQPLCRPDCRGLCPRCGKNMNQGTCSCAAEAADTRPFGKLKQFKIK
jgi:uncharacterized protein